MELSGLSELDLSLDTILQFFTQKVKINTVFFRQTPQGAFQIESWPYHFYPLETPLPLFGFVRNLHWNGKKTQSYSFVTFLFVYFINWCCTIVTQSLLCKIDGVIEGSNGKISIEIVRSGQVSKMGHFCSVSPGWKKRGGEFLGGGELIGRIR